MRFTCPFILASSSPRRRTLLSRLGIPFEVDPSGVDEWHDGNREPSDLVEFLSLEKAVDVARRHPEGLVLGADTVVVLDRQILGKPDDAAHAADMLRALNGRTHQVYSGIALVHGPSGRRVTAHSTTDVTFAPLSEDEIATYIASGSPMDKAGAYGIQDDAGAWFIEGIRGDFHTVVGLPLRLLYSVVRAEFRDLLVP
jgi:septum formation protein